MEKVEVKFKVNYFYDGSKEHPFVAQVTLLIPKRKDYTIHESLWSTDTCVFGIELGPYWGSHYDVEYKSRTISVYGNNWGEVKAKAQELIKEAIAQLKSVREKYDEAIRTKPEDETLVFEI